MEGLLISKRAELAELEKKLALEKEQLNLDVAKSIFADENVAFYKKLHAFFTTRVTEVMICNYTIVITIDGDNEEEEDGDYEGEWHLRLCVDGTSIIMDMNNSDVNTFPEFFGRIGVSTRFENLVFLAAFEAFITKCSNNIGENKVFISFSSILG